MIHQKSARWCDFHVFGGITNKGCIGWKDLSVGWRSGTDGASVAACLSRRFFFFLEEYRSSLNLKHLLPYMWVEDTKAPNKWFWVNLLNLQKTGIEMERKRAKVVLYLSRCPDNEFMICAIVLGVSSTVQYCELIQLF